MPTIYPPVAEAYFLAVHYLSPGGSGTTPIQAAAALCAVLVTLLLLSACRSWAATPGWPCCGPGAHGRPGGGQQRARGRAGRVFTVAALILLARPGPGARAPPLAGGALLGLAIATKVTPVLVAPAVLRRRRPAR